MPPLMNRYPPHHYHPFSRPLALHSSFLAERHACLPHSLYTLYPTDPDVTAVDRPKPLMHKQALLTAADYFAILKVQKTNVPFPKNEGEVGRKPGKSHKGYVLADVLAWPMEVYKEVQVNNIFSLVACANDLRQSTIHKLAKEDLPVATLAQQKADDLEAFYKKVKYPQFRL